MRHLQTNNMVIGVAGNVEPGAGIDQSGVPALQNIGGVGEPASQSMQSISWKKNPENKKAIIRKHPKNKQKQNQNFSFWRRRTKAKRQKGSFNT